MPQDSILFGSIAVATGKVTPDQLKECLDLQERWATIGVRKLLGQVLREKGYLSDRDLRGILRAQGYKEQRLESKDFARIAVDCGFANMEQVRDGLARQKEAYKRGEGMRSLGRLLMDQGVLDRRAHETVMRTVNRIHGRTATQFRSTSVLYGVKECGVCFEMIDFQADHCDRCGSFLGAVDIKPACPGCRATQEPGGEYCSKCGANMLTGLQDSHPAQARCHGCGGFLAAGQEHCYRCGRERPLPFARRLAAWALRRGVPLAGNVAGQLLLVAALVALVLGVVWLPAIAREARALVRGEDVVQLESAFEELRSALIYGDEAGARAKLAPGPVAAAGRDALFRAILGASATMTEVEILSVGLDQARIEGDSGVTYAQVEARCAVLQGSAEEAFQDLWSVVQGGIAPSGKKIVKRRLTWRWQRSGGRWLLQPGA